MRRPPPDAAAMPVDAPAIVDAAVAAAPVPAPPDPLAGKSREEQWAWAVSVVPDLNTYAKRPRDPVFDGLGLKGGSVTLYSPAAAISNLDKPLAPCTALPMKLDKETGALKTFLSLDGKRIGPALKLKSYVELELGVTPYDTRTEDGNGIGQEGFVRGYLSEVTKSGLHYDGDRDSMHVICSKHVTKQQCLDGTTQVCELCNPVVVPEHAGVGSIGTLAGGKPVECKPCPPDPVPSYHLDAINRVLQDQPLMRVDKDSGPAFFTRQAECKAALKKKPPKPEE